MKKGYDHFTCTLSSRVASDAAYLPARGIFTKTGLIRFHQPNPYLMRA
jgi:hypothetical protein